MLMINDKRTVALVVLDCGTTFLPDYGGRDLPPDSFRQSLKLIYLATEALSD